MARQSATARKRRTRTKRAVPDVDEDKTAASEPIEPASEPSVVLAEQSAAPARTDRGDPSKPEPAARTHHCVEEPERAAEPVIAVQEPFVPADRPLTLVREWAIPADKPLTLVREPDMPADEPITSAEEPAMPARVPLKTPMEAKARLDRITLQWCDLAERRLQHYTELYRSGRWRRYYTEERFVVVMNEVAKTVANWRALANA